MTGRSPWAHRTAAAALCLLALAAPGCGGGSSTLASAPGTGGTGYTSTGTIKGFGSVKVNGVFYDDSQASVRIDGQSATAAQLGLGMLVTVQGQLAGVAGTGSAQSIDAWSQAQGLVSAVGDSGFTLAGMNLRTDSTTVYRGLASAASLRAGQRLRVFALPTNAALTQWLATRVELLDSSVGPVVSTGVVAADGLHMNGLTLTGAALASGQSVRVSGTLVGAQLSLDAVQALPGVASGDSLGDEELEGLITQLAGGGRFLLGSSVVDASQAVVSGGSGVTVGAQVEVQGRWVGGVFQASAIVLESQSDLSDVEITGDISAFVSLADFTVRGQRCDASGLSAVGNATLAALKVGVRVQLQGQMHGDLLQVTQIELN